MVDVDVLWYSLGLLSLLQQACLGGAPAVVELKHVSFTWWNVAVTRFYCRTWKAFQNRPDQLEQDLHMMTIFPDAKLTNLCMAGSYVCNQHPKLDVRNPRISKMSKLFKSLIFQINLAIPNSGFPTVNYPSPAEANQQSNSSNSACLWWLWIQLEPLLQPADTSDLGWFLK